MDDNRALYAPKENAMATPTKWGNEFVVNTVTMGPQYESKITALADGRMVVVWTDYEIKQPPSPPLWTVKSQILNADGSKSGPESIVYSAVGLGDSHPDVAARPDGSYVVTWVSTDLEKVMGQIFDVNGAKVGANFTPNPAGGALDDPSVAGGNFFAEAWIDLTSNSIRARIYDPQGNPSGSAFTVSANAPGATEDNLTVTTLNNGSFVASWEQHVGGQLVTHAQIFSTLGQKIGPEYQTNPTTGGENTPTVAALANGGFVLAWDNFANGNVEILAQMVAWNGTPIGPQFLIGPANAGLAISDIEITGLPDGRFAAVWHRSGLGLEVQVYNAEGTPSGAAYDIVDDNSLVRFDPHLSTLADGRFVVSWTQVDPGPNPQARYDVGAQIFDPRESAVDLQGTALDDDLIDTKYDDVMRGGIGNDRLDGREGNDLLLGSAGADTLIGGIGIDTASYQTSKSYVKVNLTTGTGTFGDAAGDTLSGIENLIGSKFNDTLTGDAQDNVLTGSAGADLLDGAGGSDTASYAGSSTGVLVDLSVGMGKGGDAQGDLLSSIENLLGSSYNDSLLGDAGANILNGGAGHDTLTGRAGNDVFLFEKLTDGADIVTDFSVGADHFQLFAGHPTPLPNLIGQVHFENGATASGQGATVLFDEYTGSVAWDADGNGAGAATQVATLHLAGPAGVQTMSGILGYSMLGTGDFNGDATSDVALRNINNGEVRVWSIQNGQIVDSHDIGNRSGYIMIGTGDFNGDGSDDMLWKNNTTGVTETWLMQNGNHTGGSVQGSMTGYTALATGDFNGDGTDDIVWRNDATGATDIWEMNNDQPSLDVSLGNTAGYTLLGTGDFNADGTTDMLWQNNATGTVQDWLMKDGQHNGGFTFADVTAYKLLGTGDFNHDGTTDLLWQNKSSGEVVDWLLKDGNFGGGIESFGIAAANLQKIGIGDFNHDGGNDVLWYDPGTNSTKIWDIEHQHLGASDFLIGT